MKWNSNQLKRQKPLKIKGISVWEAHKVDYPGCKSKGRKATILNMRADGRRSEYGAKGNEEIGA